MKPLTFLASSIGFAALTVLVSAACADDQSSTGNPKARTILNTKCASCHGPETQKAELNLSSLAGIGRGGESGKLINSDKPEESLILEMIESGQMPPEGEAPLTGNERQLLRHWILDLARNPERLKVSPKALSQLDVQPLMLRRCWMCHGPEYQMGGLDLRTRDAMLAGGDSGSALIAGDADKSPMVLRVREQKCPPKADIGEAGIEPMTPDELKTLEAWIRQGAPLVPVEPDVAFGNNDPLVSDADRQFWSFQPPTRSAPPDVEQPELVRTPVDSFLLRQLEAEKLTFSPETDRVTLIRRASYALLGLPPSPELIER